MLSRNHSAFTELVAMIFIIIALLCLLLQGKGKTKQNLFCSNDWTVLLGD